MSEILGQVYGNCKASGEFFPGSADCDITPGKITALIFHLPRERYPLNPKTFNDSLQGYSISSGTDKLIVVDDIVDTEVSGGEFAPAEVGTSGIMRNERLSGRQDTYTVLGGVCRMKQLLQLNNRNLRVMRVDENGNIFGTATVPDTTGNGFMGFSTASIYVREVPVTGTDLYAIHIWISYTNNFEREIQNTHAFQIPVVPHSLLGLRLIEGSVPNTVRVAQMCGNIEVTGSYEWTPPAFISDAGSNPTSVSYNPDTGNLTIAPTGNYRVAPAEILHGLDIVGYDGSNQYFNISQ